MFRSCALPLLALTWVSALGQGRDNLWLGGFESYGGPPPFGGSVVDFQNGPLNIYYVYRDIDIKKTTANISSATGDLLFFTNGVVVGGANGDTLQNGAGLNPSTYTDDFYPTGLHILQANLILPVPDDPGLYWLFHNTIDHIPEYTSQYLYVTTVDMALNGGQGGVTTKNQVLFDGDMQPGHLNAVKHGNGRDWWVYAHEYDSDVFLRWLVTPQGISGPVQQSVGSMRPMDAGQVAFSEDGLQFAYYNGETGLDLFAVDRCTGAFIFIGHVDVSNSIYGYGVALSPNGRFVYLGSEDKLYQVDGQASDLQASLLEIAEWDSTYSPGPPFATLFGALQLAPDGKIYISTMNGTDKLHVINHPDSLGLACDIVQHGIALPTYWSNSLPNHPNYHLGALDGSICDSLALGVVELPENLNLSLYPNPNVGAFAITFAPQPSSGVLEVHALDGRTVYRESVAPWSQLKRVQLPVLSPGIYQCKVRFGQSEGVMRFVVE